MACAMRHMRLQMDWVLAVLLVGEPGCQPGGPLGPGEMRAWELRRRKRPG